jgi:Chaperone of endosialidase/Head domain of trimeric autotransporter adhesin
MSTLSSNTSGSLNTALGFEAGLGLTTGSGNVFLGEQSGSGSQTNNSIAIGNSALVTASNATAIGAFAEASESNALVLGSINGINGATASTSVGIGTTAPGATLEIDGSNQADLFIKAPYSGVGAGLDLFTTGSIRDMQWEILNTGAASAQGANKLNIRNVNTAQDVFTILANGYVGISSTNPSNLLTLVQGGGPAIADGWNTYSSRRWKINIHPLQNALNKVEQLRGVSYDLKDSGKHEIGVIAEEVGAVVPEVVSYEENGKDARGVDYSRLTALLIEAVNSSRNKSSHSRHRSSDSRSKSPFNRARFAGSSG